MQIKFPEVKKSSAYLIISCALLLVISFNLNLVPRETWNRILSGIFANFATVLNPVVNYPVGSGPQSVFASDFNNDGNLDLVVANAYGNTVSVLLGSADGTFGSQTSFIVGAGPVSVTSADFNNDGHLDIATANIDVGTISILLGDGNGSFGAANSFEIVNQSSAPVSITASDFNNDGNQDLAVVIYEYDLVYVLSGNGDGTFVSSGFGVGSGPQSVFASDFNNDGSTDLVAVNYYSNTYSVLMNDGIGGFAPSVNYPLGIHLTSVFSADLNNDGKKDLVIASDSGLVYRLLGNGNGTFGTAASFNAGANPISVFASDLDNDGKVDLAVANNGSNDISIFTGDGSGGFILSDSLNAGSGIYSVFAADLNNDGKQDLMSANSNANNLSVFLSTPDSTLVIPYFSLVATYPFSARTSIVPSDFNNDGKVDLGISDSSGGFSVLTGDGTGEFDSSPVTPIDAHQLAIFSADFDNDGKQDLLTSNHSEANNNVSVLLGNGIGDFTQQTTFTVGIWRPQSSFASDFNNDGKQDVITGYSSSFGYTNEAIYAISILLGNGTGGFSSITGLTPGIFPSGLFAADFNNDGKQDFVAIDSSAVYIFIGNGDGSFQPKLSLNLDYPPRSIFVSDFNNDGNQDFVTAHYVDNTISVFLGDGDGNFTSSDFSVTDGPNYIIAADLNNDGKQDLVTANYFYNTVSVFLGDGMGAFQPSSSFDIGGRASSVSVADLNNDGKKDLVVSRIVSVSAPAAVLIYLNVDPNPISTISNITPTTKTVGEPQFVLTVNGTDFMSSSIVQFDGSARATTFVSPTQLTAVIPITDLTAIGNFPITVINPAPGGGVSNPQTLFINGTSPLPSISSISPSSKLTTDPTGTLIVNGSNFVPSSIVRLNNSNRLTVFINSTQLAAVILASDLITAAVIPVTVFNSTPGGGTSNILNLIVDFPNPNSPSTPTPSATSTSGTNPIPTIVGIGPTVKKVGDSTFTMTVNGRDFVSSSTVRFNGSDRATTFISSTQLTAVISNLDLLFSGAYPITVFNPAPGGGVSKIGN